MSLETITYYIHIWKYTWCGGISFLSTEKNFSPRNFNFKFNSIRVEYDYNKEECKIHMNAISYRMTEAISTHISLLVHQAISSTFYNSNTCLLTANHLLLLYKFTLCFNCDPCHLLCNIMFAVDSSNFNGRYRKLENTGFFYFKLFVFPLYMVSTFPWYLWNIM